MALIRPANQPQPTGQVQSVSPSMGEVYDATLDASELNFQSYSRGRAQQRALTDREALFEQKTGQKVKDATGATYDDPVLRYSKLDEIIEQGRKDNPDIYGGIPTSTEVQNNAREKARTSQSKADGIKAEAGGATGLLSSFAGEFVAGVQDPLNAAAMLIPGGAEAKGVLGVAKVSAQAGLVNAGAEIILQPSVASWQQEIGNEYGLSDAGEQVGMAFLFGGAFEGTTRAVTSGGRFLKRKTGEFISRRRGTPQPATASEEIFPHLLTQESGNRQTDETGAPITSPKGATGIAQIMPDTGPEAAKLAGLPWDVEKFKNDADYNSTLGKAYFDKQIETYGSPEVALLAYNAGPGAVSDFMHGTNLSEKNPKGIKLGDPSTGEISPQEFVRQFPFKESRDYATAIMGKVENTTPDLAPYMKDARDVKELLTKTPTVDTSSPAALQKALGYRPKSLSQFIKESGGIRDDMGELAARDVKYKSLPGLVRKSREAAQRDIEGFSDSNQLDFIKQRIFDEGYFPDRMDYNDISDSDLFDAIADDLNGQKRYTGDDLERIATVNEGSDLIDQYDRVGISPHMTEEEIAHALHGMDVPDEFAVHDTASRYFEAIASSPRAPAWSRSAYANMAEFADSLATSPFERDTPAMRDRHLNNLAEVDKSIRAGKKINADDLDIEGVRPRFRGGKDAGETTASRMQKPVTSDEIADVLKPEEAKQFRATQKRDFDQRVEAEPEAKVLMDDGRTITMRELADELDEAARHVDEIKTCGLG